MSKPHIASFRNQLGDFSASPRLLLLTPFACDGPGGAARSSQGAGPANAPGSQPQPGLRLNGDYCGFGAGAGASGLTAIWPGSVRKISGLPRNVEIWPVTWTFLPSSLSMSWNLPLFPRET